jgi:hypothetical protein
MNTPFIILSLITLGLSAICTQLVLLREFLNIFSGNKLIISAVLAYWFLLTGLGAGLGRVMSPGEVFERTGNLIFHVS